MSIEAVKDFFASCGMQDRILEFDVSSATVELAAKALNCAPCRIAKTLSFMVSGAPVLIVTAGDTKIDNPKYKAQFGAKAKMLTPDEANGSGTPSAACVPSPSKTVCASIWTFP